MLVKLLDAGQRLPVHVHPDRAFAVRHLGSRHGKTEAWVVLGTCGCGPGGLCWLAPRRRAAGAFSTGGRAGHGKRCSDLLNKLTVEPGDAVLVPAGTAHAIGVGVFSLELQEPTDFSIMLELEGFDIDPAGAYVGLDRELALSCVEQTGAWRPGPGAGDARGRRDAPARYRRFGSAWWAPLKTSCPRRRRHTSGLSGWPEVTRSTSSPRLQWLWPLQARADLEDDEWEAR